ncbi:hypothetical protein PASE110613_09190 [Paenibacillus sediminis]|uniref:Uncharacterized protein n=1 Tax=Paenibacillus sediminis TaxID=664909 RepID=A0ABS4H6K9_9BACL|nr:hypothetical protein [Paenibacillus sediminis]MBP1938178.1 hypothetical protein [Paenibacillus sediminis]
MQNVMKEAVVLARTYEGDWVARMALALKTVWARIKEGVKKVKATIDIRVARGGRDYVAKIVGPHRQYKLDRQFLAADREEWNKKGSAGHEEYDVEDGYYEKSELGKKRYMKVENGAAKYINLEEVQLWAAKQPYRESDIDFGGDATYEFGNDVTGSAE